MCQVTRGCRLKRFRMTQKKAARKAGPAVDGDETEDEVGHSEMAPRGGQSSASSVNAPDLSSLAVSLFISLLRPKPTRRSKQKETHVRGGLPRGLTFMVLNL
jgi:general stress protein YciG